MGKFIGYLSYRGIMGTLKQSDRDGMYYGHVIDVNENIPYEGVTKEEAEYNFHLAVDILRGKKRVKHAT